MHRSAAHLTGVYFFWRPCRSMHSRISPFTGDLLGTALHADRDHIERAHGTSLGRTSRTKSHGRHGSEGARAGDQRRNEGNLSGRNCEPTVNRCLMQFSSAQLPGSSWGSLLCYVFDCGTTIHQSVHPVHERTDVPTA